jgi:hypothetical protein
MATFDERIDGWRDTLAGARDQAGNEMTPEQVEIAIALIQMLNKSQPDVWNIEACDQIVARFVTEIIDNGTINIDQIMINMASQANASIGDEYDINTEWYRNLFVKIFATTATASVTYLTLQAYFPGALSYALDSAYALFEVLKSQGVSDAKIIKEVAKDSPFSAGPFAAAAAQASLNLAKATLYACVAVAGTCIQVGAQVASSVVPECLKYGSQLLAITLTTKVAGKVTDAAVSMGTAAYGVATGSADKQIAEFFRSGGPGRLKAAASNAVSSAAKAAVDFTKEALFNGLEAINNIINGRPLTVENPANRFMININDDILRWLDEYIKRFTSQDQITAFLGELIGKLSEINFEQTEDEITKQTQDIANYFGIEQSNKGFRSLVAVYRLATDTKDILEELSQPELGATYRGSKEDFSKQHSLPPGYKYPEGPNPHVVEFNQKVSPLLGPVASSTTRVRKSELYLIPTLEAVIKDVGLENVRFPIFSNYKKRTVRDVLAKLPDDIQLELIEIIKNTPTELTNIGSPIVRTNNKRKNNMNYMFAIEKYLSNDRNYINKITKLYKKPTKKLLIQTEEGLINKSNSQERALFNTDNTDEEINAYLHEIDNDVIMGNTDDDDAMEEGGSRRRHRKSRQYKKKRSTLKRRQMKRRRTQKGKKRRHTKKR